LAYMPACAEGRTAKAAASAVTKAGWCIVDGRGRRCCESQVWREEEEAAASAVNAYYKKAENPGQEKSGGPGEFISRRRRVAG
jgi:hypothetical protein